MNAKRVLFIYDNHCPYQDVGVQKIALDFMKDFRPHDVIFGGDLVDCTQISDKFADETGRAFSDDLIVANEVLDLFKPSVYMLANHEARITRIGSMLPVSLRSMFDLHKHLHLKERKIKTFPYHPVKGIYKIGHLKVLHGFWTGVYYTAKTATVFGNSVCGHSHRTQTASPPSAGDTRTCFGVGCMSRLVLPWMEDRPPMGHNNGFGFAYFNRNGTFSFYQVRIIDGKTIINGKSYGR